MRHAQAGAITASGDTTKTSLGVLQVPMSMKKIVGVWCYAVGGPGFTTLENMTGIFELESPDVNLQPLQLPLDCVCMNTDGSSAFSPRIFPVDIAVKGGEKITAYVTMDMAITLASTCRFGLIYD